MSFAPEPGNGGLPRIVATAADGARVEAYLQGAHVTSWQPAGDAAEQLFVSAKSRFTPGAAIRGGVPVCFPQFADQGTLPMHGFARVTSWALIHAHRNADGAAEVLLRLADTEATRALWPHAFVAEFCATAAGRTLTLALTVRNAGRTALAFTAALHTYLRVAAVEAAAVHGLQGVRYRDKVLATDGEVEAAAALALSGPLDRVYYAAPSDLALREGSRVVAVRATGFPDTVIWNPGASGEAIADLESGGCGRMVCVEAAAARGPVAVAPGETWRGVQSLTAA